LKNILGRIIAVWAIIIFFIPLLPVALLLWIIGVVKEPQRTKIFRATVYVWMGVWLFLCGCRLKIKGKKNFQKGKNYIITCNHNSFMDVPVSTPFIPGPNKTIAKIEMSKIPIFGIIYKRGSVLVDRKDPESRKDSFRKMRAVLENGMHMCIYPEGTRNKTDQPLTPFHEGAFRLAIETGRSIIPAVIFNTRKVLPAGKDFFFWPAYLQMHFLPPIPVDSNDDPVLLKDKVHAIMEDYYVKMRADL
jgi:1-acyl-sn-glycerol-3-phosphate acyltransferase